MRSLYASLSAYGVKTKILRRKIPLIASFKLTYACNLRCAGCPFHLMAGLPGTHLEWDQAVSALDSLRDSGCSIVIFEGGEPLLWRCGSRGFNDITAEAKKRFPRVGVTTNGTLPLEVDTDILWVSIDGPEKVHNALRDNSYAQIMENISKARHPRLFIHYTVNRENISGIQQCARELSLLPRVKGVSFQFFYPYHLGEKDLALSREERIQAVRDIAAAARTGGIPVLNSLNTLKRMAEGTWTCREWLLANVYPDGRITGGCYVRGRSEVRCSECGFTPVAEASRAFTLHLGSLLAGFRIFS
ncbi:MAG: radical SAM protein [Spirochaetales bacterium]|nr:MAG: radical SAM protein [Spirochaetales bacterium]